MQIIFFLILTYCFYLENSVAYQTGFWKTFNFDLFAVSSWYEIGSLAFINLITFSVILILGISIFVIRIKYDEFWIKFKKSVLAFYFITFFGVLPIFSYLYGIYSADSVRNNPYISFVTEENGQTHTYPSWLLLETKHFS